MLHDQSRLTLAAAAWIAMFLTALAVAAETSDGDEVELPSNEWQRNVLEILLGRMYEDRSLEDALQEAIRLLLQGDGFGEVQSRLAAAVSEQVGGARLLRASINRLDNFDA